MYTLFPSLGFFSIGLFSKHSFRVEIPLEVVLPLEVEIPSLRVLMEAKLDEAE